MFRDRRILIGGLILLLLWWRPWRRFRQQGTSIESYAPIDTMPAAPATTIPVAQVVEDDALVLPSEDELLPREASDDTLAIRAHIESAFGDPTDAPREAETDDAATFVAVGDDQGDDLPVVPTTEEEDAADLERIDYASSDVGRVTQPLVLDDAPPSPTPPTPTGSDDLQIIEGIGPKIAGILQSAGISTLAELADTDTARLEEILRGAGLRLANPATWPEQARLADSGQLEALKALQMTLKGGRQAPTNS